MEKYTLMTARDKAGLNLKTAAGELGISVDTLTSYEKGITYPNAPVIQKMLDLYQVSFDQIIFLKPNHG